jgi:pilus assembly protein CpaF
MSTVSSRRDTPAVNQVDQLKVELHRRLIDRLDLAALERIQDDGALITQIRQAVAEFLRSEQTPLSAAEREEVIEQIVYEVTGLGPLEPLFRDPTISDILVNGPKDCYVERRGKLQRVNIAFRDDAHLLTIIDRIVSKVGRRVDESSPMVDARLPDGSRVNASSPHSRSTAPCCRSAASARRSPRSSSSRRAR